MNINSLKFTGLLVLVALLAIGCASVNYVGKSFEPTTNVDLYFSKEDIEKEKGADAVLITEIDNQNSLLSEADSDPDSEVKASFLKYK